MDLLKGAVRRIYFKYLSAAFGSAMITSVYAIVDMAMVGQYHGPAGTAALAVIQPVWNIIYSLGLLMGIGGSVLFGMARGKTEEKNSGVENEYFTAAVIGAVFLAAVAWAGILLLERPILLFFGADESLLPMAERYLAPIKFVFPLYLFNQVIAAFLRNDNRPELAAAGVLAGGLFNMAGDYVFVFALDMGILGAGLATAIGAVLNFIVVCSHFFSKKNTLALKKPGRLFFQLKEITVTGFPTFFIDIAMGILTVLFNRQIMKYLGTDALSVYGLIINISTFVQCCAYSVGQAAQPIISINLGAKQYGRIRETLRYALYSTTAFGVFWTALSLAFPNLYVYIFMKPTAEILGISSGIIRAYSSSFLLLPLNIFSAYYFQAVMKPKTAFAVSVFRGCIISGILIMALPALAGANSIWLAMLFTEILTAAYVAARIARFTRELSEKPLP